MLFSSSISSLFSAAGSVDSPPLRRRVAGAAIGILSVAAAPLIAEAGAIDNLPIAIKGFGDPGWSSIPNATYQEWDVFTSARGSNAPKAVVPAGSNADLYDSTAPVDGAFLTGSGNIYSPTGATSPIAVIPSFSMQDAITTVELQVVTLGRTLDLNKVLLTYSGGSLIPASSAAHVTFGANGQGGTNNYDEFLFHVPAGPAFFTIMFPASDTSMSLDQVRIDSITEPNTAAYRTGMLAPVAVPEPVTTAGFIIGGVAILARRRRAV